MNKLWKPALLIAAVGIMAFGVLSSGAWFTDSASSAPNSLSSGTLSIADGSLSSITLGSVTNMAPGDVTGPVEIIIKNNGTLPLIWFGDLEASGSGLLKQAIYVDDAQMEFIAAPGGTWGEGTDHFITAGLGSGLYPSWYNTLAGTSSFSVVTLDVFDGNNGMGDAPYEFMGALKPGFSYKLTLKFGMAPLAGNPYQNQGPLNIKFNVLATQTDTAAIHAVNASWPAASHASWAAGQLASQVVAP